LYCISDTVSQPELENRAKNANLTRLVLAYRNHGHRIADLDPLNLTKAEYKTIN
jgi:2-oxoglutarate dehydrogenase complex dehydrogenase (E1) component-like enzyme